MISGISDLKLIEHEPANVRMKKVATIFISIVKKDFDLTLDMTYNSINLLDEVISNEWGYTTKPIPNEVILGFGAYLGEIIKNQSKGRWVSGFSDENPATIFYLPKNEQSDSISISPFLIIRDKFNNHLKYSITTAFDVIMKILEENKQR